METNNGREKAADLAGRVRAAQLPPPDVRARIRRNARATLRDLADVLGVTPMTVRRWESGEVEPRLNQAAAYARLLADIEAASTPVKEAESA